MSYLWDKVLQVSENPKREIRKQCLIKKSALFYHNDKRIHQAKTCLCHCHQIRSKENKIPVTRSLVGLCSNFRERQKVITFLSDAVIIHASALCIADMWDVLHANCDSWRLYAWERGAAHYWRRFSILWWVNRKMAIKSRQQQPL